ncbi:dnaJ-like protein subfamily B member 6-like [Cucumis melo var. makuwa]|uniref:DnaJ-like protein subfamily B member 6-like n=1 Tax=Cucumis melo var. makuwa TaxID=1194695 RepID=A0A5D3BY97_CUCMM|nr:dnaJ-like protein subfamily B member 6-like [Cucumis melo var. makuwa]
MAGKKQKNDDLYAVLGLKKECSEAELKNAYKKLALRWHPDRCSASGDSKFVEEAKKKFQTIQQAYSVLSDANKRLLYDVGVYDSDDDDDDGMGDFLTEMVAMMDQTTPNENGEESFEKLQELFQEMFNDDMDGLGPNSPAGYFSSTSSSSSSSSSSYSECSTSSNKRNSSDMNNFNSFQAHHVHNFSMGKEENKRAKAKNRGGTTCRLWHREDDNEGEIGIIVDQIFQRKWC